jgi:glycosyltransferase involved in cell wall biosynthesis
VRVLVVLDYYYPHWTGLSAYAKRIAEGLVKSGHSVSVLASRHDPSLAVQEDINGVRVIRLPVAARFSRGVIMPTLPVVLYRLIQDHDIVHIHTPMPEVGFATSIARMLGKPSLVTHQGDIVMPKGFINGIIQKGSAVMTLGLHFASYVVVHSADYGANSKFLAPFAHKLGAIYPPIDLPVPQCDEIKRMKQEMGLADKKLVGFAGRFVEEKGFDILLQAIPLVVQRDPSVHFLYAGETNVAYERFYERLVPLIEQNREAITMLGLLRDQQLLANFYAMCDAFVIPSRTDCFPSVQVEAMLAGTPVVTSDIPGAREAVKETGMGLLVAPENPQALADGILMMLANRPQYTQHRDAAAAVFDYDRSIAAYEELLLRMVRG